MANKKFAVVSCEDAEKWGGEIGCGWMVADFIKDGNVNEEWQIIQGVSGLYPSKDELKTFDAFIFTGSHYSANESLEWISKMEQFIKMLVSMQTGSNEKKPKIFGSCFGHQIINKALGAKVSKNTLNKFVFKLEKVSLNQNFTSQDFLKNLPVKKHFYLMESHGEEVVDLPAAATVCGSSKSASNEVVMYGDHILTIQSHPELTLDLMTEKILPALNSKSLLSEKDQDEMWDTFNNRQNEGPEFIKVIRSFLYD